MEMKIGKSCQKEAETVDPISQEHMILLIPHEDIPVCEFHYHGLGCC